MTPTPKNLNESDEELAKLSDDLQVMVERASVEYSKHCSQKLATSDDRLIRSVIRNTLTTAIASKDAEVELLKAEVEAHYKVFTTPKDKQIEKLASQVSGLTALVLVRDSELCTANQRISELEQLLSGKNVEGMK